MGQITEHGVYSPDADDTVEPDVYLATMAASINNGIGNRVQALETFVGCNLALTAGVTGTSTTTKVSGFTVQAPGTAPGSFNQGLTVSNGTVTVPEAGIYTVLFSANFLPTNTTASRVNTYIFVNGVSYNFSSAFGESVTSRYTNCNVTAVYNLKKNDQLDVRIATFDGATQLVGGTGSSFCVTLTSRTLA